jgi:hypothetical protein
MRQGGLSLDERGPEFEKYCREELRAFLERCPVRQNIQISECPVRFLNSAGVAEEIDLVLVVHDTILLIEAKCILWPDEAVHFANYRSTVKKASSQVERKRREVDGNFSAFSAALEKAGCVVPTQVRTLACVMTNSAVYAGFRFGNVPVVDLNILKVFFSARHISSQVWEGNVVTGETVIILYRTASEAALKLEEFLNDPPQLKRMKSHVEPRTVAHELSNSAYRKLVMSTYQVNIDVEAEMLANTPTVLSHTDGAESRR